MKNFPNIKAKKYFLRLALVASLTLLSQPTTTIGAPLTVEWIRQIGTSSDDESTSVAVDGSGNSYISGYTFGSLEGTNAGGRDAYLAKFDSSGNPLWTRQIGTSNHDYCNSVAVDGTGNAYISGTTHGSLEGTKAGKGDAYLSKFDSSGNQLWIQQIGTSSFDSGYSVAVDYLGNAYISGVTGGSLEGTNAGGYDAYLSKFDSSGYQLWTQQIGTRDLDRSNSVAVDSSGNAYICGATNGSLEGTNAGEWDTYLAKFDSSGNPLWTQQIGTSSDDFGYSVAVDGLGNAYISGVTGGSLEGTNAGGRDAYLAKFDSSGNQLWIQQIGTSSSDYSFSIAVDGSGNAYLSSATAVNLEGTNTYEFVTQLSKFDSSGNQLWSQQIRTSNGVLSWSVAVDSLNNAYLSGVTGGSLEGTNAGGIDAFLIKFSAIPEPTSFALAMLGLVPLALRRRR